MSAFPEVFPLRQVFSGPAVDDVAGEVHAQLAGLGLDRQIKSGQSVAITAGSRGITNIDVIIRAAVDYLKSISAAPFIIPAMGSHGGGAASGQQAVLESLGITESSMGCPIRASMETVVLGEAEQGLPIHFDRYASEADHVLVCGRVKPHTMFAGPLQSGLIKMLFTGLGKHAGAELYHRAFVDYGFEAIARSVSPIILERGKVVAGLAILENGYGQTAHVEAVPPERFETRQSELLELATQWMAGLPFDRADILIVDEIGKHISGTGMDTNVVGRKFNDHAAVEGETPQVRRIVIRSVVHGNATGIGLAEFCTTRAIQQTDFAATRINCITANHVSAAMPPPDFATDRELLEVALTTIGLTPPEQARLIWIESTKQLERLACSAAYLDEARARNDLQVLSSPHPLPFDHDGNLPHYVTDTR